MENSYMKTGKIILIALFGLTLVAAAQTTSPTIDLGGGTLAAAGTADLLLFKLRP